MVGEPIPLDLARSGRKELTVGETFSESKDICYIVLTASSNQIYSYLKFYDSENFLYRAAIPTARAINRNEISISHIAIGDGWWTGLALLNTNSEKRNLLFTFRTYDEDGNIEKTIRKSLKLLAGAYQSINLADFIDDEDELDPTSLNSAVISNADGVIGLEIFGNQIQLAGISLCDTTATTIYYPYIVNDAHWWTGLVVFNPALDLGGFTIMAYDTEGHLLDTNPPSDNTERNGLGPISFLPIDPYERIVGTNGRFGLPPESAWMVIKSSIPLTGFELFGTTDGLQLAGYTCTAIEGTSGILPKLEKNGWTGIAMVNTIATPTIVTLKAYTDTGGQAVATINIPLKGHQRLVDTPENLFTEELGDATYITYQANAPVVAFQLNGNGAMLDALPGH